MTLSAHSPGEILEIHLQAELQVARASRPSSVRVVRRGNHAVVIRIWDGTSGSPVHGWLSVLGVVEDIERFSTKGGAYPFRNGKAFA